MKIIRLSATGSAVLTVTGIILFWTNLRFAGALPCGFKLLILALLIVLWFIQMIAELSCRTMLVYRCGLITAGVALVFYLLSAIESFRLFRVNHLPTADWIILTVSAILASGVIILLVFHSDGEKENL